MRDRSAVVFVRLISLTAIVETMVVLADRTNAAPRDFTVVMTPDALEYEEVSSQEDARAEKARVVDRLDLDELLARATRVDPARMHHYATSVALFEGAAGAGPGARLSACAES